MGDKVKSRSSSVADEGATSFAKQMNLYVTNSAVFKQAIASAVQEAVFPLQAEIASLKSDLINLRSQLVEAKAKSNDNEQYSQRNNIRVFGLPEEAGIYVLFVLLLYMRGHVISFVRVTIFVYLTLGLKGIRNLFFFSSMQLWNSLPSTVRLSLSLSSFKHNVLKCLKFPIRNYLFFNGDRTTSVFHTRLRLNFSALNYDLFKRNCSASSACPLCDAPIEDAKHYFLLCPSLLLCVKHYLPSLHICWDIHGLTRLSNEKVTGF